MIEQNKTVHFDSRHRVLAELQSAGLNTALCDGLSIESLDELMSGIRRILHAHQCNNKRPSSSNPRKAVLTHADKKIIARLMSSSGRVSSSTLAKELEIPLTTLQRHKKRLEGKIIETSYSIRFEELGWRKVTFLASISKRDPVTLGKEILGLHRSIISVRRIIGSANMDLAIEMIFKTNEEIVRMMEKLRSLAGVEQIAWIESIGGTIANNDKYYEEILR